MVETTGSLVFPTEPEIANLNHAGGAEDERSRLELEPHQQGASLTMPVYYQPVNAGISASVQVEPWFLTRKWILY